ncbi:hypothetical protein INT43_007658 [Umbelopsis isabellina]|uniref:Uncharacterized protein n=1 Tax=Mortierella isabellina TaxID=91625 RepID=A0A8H7PP55_MORIS|nr:hypothetical protein INT43_007658 [Umbelopsis isabellina]
MSHGANIRALHRQLLRAGTFATRTSNDSKRILWSKIRDGFKEHHNERDANKLEELMANAAGQSVGKEHAIVKNLTTLHYFRSKYAERPPFYNKKQPLYVTQLHYHAYDEIDLTISMLNKTLGLCLR